MQNKVAYGSSSEIFHRNDDALGVEYTVFKPDAGRDIWYATRTK
ncbi:hypothetical protein [Clostridium sp. 'deep sea']|nr:hypothetical protein [Clostridium sp. 'deep sea']